MRIRTRNGEHGVAMVTVMMIVLVLTLLMVATVNYAIQSQPLSRRDQDWNAALAAAQAGVDDYLYRLQQDGGYYVTSTGRVRGVQRTIRANMRRRGFLDYLYMTDYESLDPLSGYYSDPATATAQCSRYWWQGRPSPPTCVRISFVTGDEINGPLHSNDTISVNGSPQFNGAATTGYSGTMSCPPSGTALPAAATRRSSCRATRRRSRCSPCRPATAPSRSRPTAPPARPAACTTGRPGSC